MFGIRFVKTQPTDYIIQYKGGKIIREGTGLSFFYSSLTTSLVLIPIESSDIPFIFEELSADFQHITIQGQISYRISDPKKLSQMMNFAVASNGKDYVSDDPQKLPQRLINHAQVLTGSALKTMSLRKALISSDALVTTIHKQMNESEAIKSLGVEALGISILAIRPTPETNRALEAEAREQILRQADEAIYSRRNAAVEQERGIKENELNTEIAVENKKRQIREAQMEAEKSVQQKKREIQEAEMLAKIAIEEKNKELVALATENARHEADAKAYGMAAYMKALGQTDPKIIQALSSVGMDSGKLVALAFKELAERADKIGQLNVSPELLRELLEKHPGR